jgi:hypothetical protein
MATRVITLTGDRAMKNVAAVVLLSFVCVIGCKSKPKPEAPAGAAAPVTAAEINLSKMQSAVVPQPVQTAFGHDHPDAAIDTIRLHGTSTGDSFYEITYISKGRPGVANYFATGKAAPAN